MIDFARKLLVFGTIETSWNDQEKAPGAGRFQGLFVGEPE
jgi:hypothetical protein